MAQQLPDNTASSQADRLIQQEQLRQQQRERERDEERQKQNPVLEGVKPETIVEKTIESQKCIQVNEIQFTGVTILSESEQQAIVSDYLNRCLTLNEINKILAAITNTYFDRGYVTSRAYIPAQNLNDGVLQLRILEGKIESLQSDTLEPRAMHFSFPIESNKHLNLRDLEQGIAQLNRLSSKQVTMQLLPGRQPGYSHIRIHQSLVSGEWGIATSLDNSGQESTGDQQLGISASIDDPFGLADYASLHLQSDINSEDESGAESIALHYDIPFGYWNFDFDVSAFEYESLVEGAVETFTTSGESENVSGRISYLWYRDQKNQLGNRLSLRRKKNLNYLQDALLETSSRVLVGGELSLWYRRNIAQGQWDLTLAYEQGLDAFGSETDDGKANDVPLAQYNRIQLNGHIYKGFEWFKRSYNYQANLSAQSSDDVLYGSEQISIGSQYTVRGFKQDGVSGNKGLYVRQELITYLPKGPGWLSRNLGVFQLGLAFDWGRVENNDPNVERYSNLSGWGLVLRSYGGLVNVALELAKALNKPDRLITDDYDLYLSIQYAYRSKS